MTEKNESIVDTGEKVAFKNALGHDVAWDNLSSYSDSTEAEQEAFHADFEYVKWGSDNYFHTDGDLYQGSTLMRVIRRKADGKLFGFAYWEGGGKYGESFIEPNGDDHGFPSKYDWDDDVDEDEYWWVFLPVKSAPIPAYVFEGELTGG
jgi:hypothetical protein